jgi:hypothetical protein
MSLTQEGLLQEKDCVTLARAGQEARRRGLSPEKLDCPHVGCDGSCCKLAEEPRYRTMFVGSVEGSKQNQTDKFFQRLLNHFHAEAVVENQRRPS